MAGIKTNWFPVTSGDAGLQIDNSSTPLCDIGSREWVYAAIDTIVYDRVLLRPAKKVVGLSFSDWAASALFALPSYVARNKTRRADASFDLYASTAMITVPYRKHRHVIISALSPRSCHAAGSLQRPSESLPADMPKLCSCEMIETGHKSLLSYFQLLGYIDKLNMICTRLFAIYTVVISCSPTLIFCVAPFSPNAADQIS